MLAIEDRIFTEWRIRFCGCGMAGLWAVIIGWLFLGGWIKDSNGKLGNIDFCWIWVTGKFAGSGDPARIYDPSVFAAAHDLYFRPGECLFMPLFDYPPTLLFLTYPLGFWPFLSALMMWVFSTFLLYLTAVYIIIPRSAAVIAALAPVAVIVNIVIGHNAFLTAGLVGLSLAFTLRKPWLSGIFLGLLTYKPHFGVLFPLALFASRNWTVLATATATTLLLGLAGSIAFGFEVWPSFIFSLLNRNAGLSTDGEVELRLHSVFGLLHEAGAGIWVSWAAHAMAAVTAALAVCVIWAKPVPHSLKASALCVGSLVVTPYLLAYDVCILSVAVAFLISDGMSRGFLPGERMAALICYAGLFLLLIPTVPVVPIICVILLLLVARRVAYEARDVSPIEGNGSFRRTTALCGK